MHDAYDVSGRVLDVHLSSTTKSTARTATPARAADWLMRRLVRQLDATRALPVRKNKGNVVTVSRFEYLPPGTTGRGNVGPSELCGGLVRFWSTVYDLGADRQLLPAR